VGCSRHCGSTNKEGKPHKRALGGKRGVTGHGPEEETDKQGRASLRTQKNTREAEKKISKKRESST